VLQLLRLLPLYIDAEAKPPATKIMLKTFPGGHSENESSNLLIANLVDDLSNSSGTAPKSDRLKTHRVHTCIQRVY